MKKNGFTLVELLAVIIILAIIALIATPLIGSVIEDSRKSANKSTVELIVKEANVLYNNTLVVNNEETKAQLLKFDGATNVYDDVKTANAKPDGGILKITADGKIGFSILLDGICFNKAFDGSEVTMVSDANTCTLDDFN